MRRLLLSLSAVALVSGFIAAPIASAQQSVNFYIGGFTPRALDARPDDDVLVQNGTFLSTLNQTRGIDIGEFNRRHRRRRMALRAGSPPGRRPWARLLPAGRADACTRIS